MSKDMEEELTNAHITQMSTEEIRADVTAFYAFVEKCSYSFLSGDGVQYFKDLKAVLISRETEQWKKREEVQS